MNTADADAFSELVRAASLTEIVIVWGPGLIGWTVALHASYHARVWGFPAVFEPKVAAEMAEFQGRYQPGCDAIFSVSARDGFLATLTADGSNPTLPPGLVHLRWFIVSDASRGLGPGGRLMQKAVGFLSESGAERCYLMTFKGLDAARALYERAGFSLVASTPSMTWGRVVTEQRFELAVD
jgi:ribosomal protein S18 acetylase RimI-like enzyme